MDFVRLFLRRAFELARKHHECYTLVGRLVARFEVCFHAFLVYLDLGSIPIKTNAGVSPGKSPGLPDRQLAVFALGNLTVPEEVPTLFMDKSSRLCLFVPSTEPRNPND